VELVAGEGPLGKDEHKGVVGRHSVAHAWKVPVAKAPRGAALAVRAKLKGDGGMDSSGMIYIFSYRG
jgi:hypothetical protein